MKQEIIGRLKQFDFSKDFVIDAAKDRHYSYQAFFGRCLTIANKLKIQSANNKHTVFIMENSVELLACYFAAMLSGKIATAIDPVKEQEEIKRILDSIPDKFVVVDKAGSAKVENSDLLMEPDTFEQTKVDEGEVKDNVISLLESRDFDEDYLLTFTSGTTGNTKGVRHTLNNLVKTADAFNRYFDVDGTRVLAHYMPMTYMAGILNSIIQPFIAGAGIVVMGRFSPFKAFTFWQDVVKYNVNLFWLSPSMLTIILKASKHALGQDYCSNHDLLFFIGTAPLHLKTRQEFEAKYPVKLYASYGLSETLFLSTETVETLALGGGNVGKLLEGVEYKFGDDGEMLVKVPWMFLGYTNEPTEHYFSGDYYKTGDLAKIEDGILSITGRSKDLIIKGGMNLSPALIENVVTSIEGVEECSAFSVLNKFKEELVVLGYSSTLKDTEELEKTISAAVLNALGKNYMIDRFYQVTSIPKNVNGKNDKKVLKENYQKEVREC